MAKKAVKKTETGTPTLGEMFGMADELREKMEAKEKAEAIKPAKKKKK